MKILVAVEDKVYGKAIADCCSVGSWSEKAAFKIISVVAPIKYYIPTIVGVSDTRYIEVLEERRRSAKSLVLGVGTSIANMFPGASIEEIVIDGDAKIIILQIAKDWQADLIVMGSHSRSDLERLLLGSTSLAVLAQSPCSVMIVKLPQNNNQLSATTKQTTPAILDAAPHPVL
ncbi:hypothetical protein BH10CYA1_BH10CYA1_13710 [soil metagenome]